MYRITGTRFYSGHGRIVGNDSGAAVAAAAAIAAVSRPKKKKKKKNTKGGNVETRRITNACRPSFVAGVNG